LLLLPDNNFFLSCHSPSPRPVRQAPAPLIKAQSKNRHCYLSTSVHDACSTYSLCLRDFR
jgi:hypothetical protein